MLLFLAFCGLVLGTSLAVSEQQQQQQQQQNEECCHGELQALRAEVNSLSEDVKSLNTAFFTVHHARSFGSGSQSLFVTNEQEGNFETTNRTCIHAKGYVPSPKNEAENKALMKTLQRHNKSAYLGHVSAGYSNWAPGEPSSAKGAEPCVKMDTDGKWRATSCEEPLLITCEFSFV